HKDPWTDRKRQVPKPCVPQHVLQWLATRAAIHKCDELLDLVAGQRRFNTQPRPTDAEYVSEDPIHIAHRALDACGHQLGASPVT
ncbi:MAG: hypothetical protein WBB77_02015, partial [Candidatus Nanopelagicales bacterium]